ncbi:hypothetical protein AAG570_000953 [Ranatra chinensis]|uniref:Reverse transcriptase domain-containing protein n=1 Tax=Ranatra chinensis TaxID=642074 RepID=A0ABD0Z8Z0_9HEMI
MEGQMSTSGPPQLTVDVNTVSGLAMTAILNMPEFHGDPELLADFLEAAPTAGAHLRSVNTLLPPEAFRLVKARMAAVEEAGLATAKLAVIEELLKEAVMSEFHPRIPPWWAIGGLPEARQENAGRHGVHQHPDFISVGVIRAQGWEAGVVPCGCVATTVSGPTPLRGEIVLSLKGLSGKDRSVIVHVMDWTSTEYEAILGMDALKCVNGQVRVNGSEWTVKLGKSRYRPEGRVSLRSYVGAAVIGERGLITRANVLEYFGEVFHREGEPLSATGRVRHEIVIPDNRVVYVKPRRYPQALTEVMEEDVKNLLAQGIIRKSVSPYCSPLWVVPKTPDAQGNPRYRVVVDFKVLNKYTRPEKYPLPRLEEILDRMSGASVFSLLDLKAGYHEIRMQEADCEKTAFQFGRGKYELTRMPFGLRNAPTTFQRLMDEFLEGLSEDAIQIYMDDIIVFSRSEQEHGRHLRQLLQRFKEFGLKASCEKSSFFNESVKFMGHVLSREGIRPDPVKVEAIRELQDPVDVKGVRSIMGLVGYYRRFLPSLADRMEGWNSLTKKGTKPYVWGRQFQIKTDHKPLVWVEGLRETSARITRWKERLAPYTFQITYTEGRDNVVADCLSRMVNAIDSPSPTLDIHEEVTWNPENFDLSLLGAPEGESLEPPGLGIIARGSTLRGVTYRLTTLENPPEQDQLIKDYHVGRTNHRGIRETVAHLRRRCGVRQGQVCAYPGRTAADGDANPEKTSGASYPLATKTGEQVKEALLLFLATVGTPGTLVLDKGGSSGTSWCGGS